MVQKGIRRIGDIGRIMTQYKGVKIPTQDYDTLKRYMHLGFHDSMAEAFHYALNTAMFEQYGEPTPAQQREEWSERSSERSEDPERAAILPTPEQQKERIAKAIKKQKGVSKGVKAHVSHVKRSSKRQNDAKRP